MTILFLCREDDLQGISLHYTLALRRRGVHSIFVEPGFPLDGHIRHLLERCPERPLLILHPESGFPLLPWGLTEVCVPTACFQIDTYAYTHRRIRWSMLFDYAVLFHPHFESGFRAAGHPRPLTLPFGVDRELFERPEEDRIFEVGWVGQANGSLYKTRRRILSKLANQFRMNDSTWFHTQEQMAEVYSRSKTVVNVARDDYPHDANLRVFQAMAGGALLLTRVPSELTAVGFEDGVHFVGYREEEEVIKLVRRYLRDERARQCIAEAGRGKVLREHTYDRRVEALLTAIEQDAGRLFAPARQWSEEKVRLMCLDYYAAHRCLDYAYGELQQIAHRSFRNTLMGISLIARAWARQSRSWVIAKVMRNSRSSNR
jgi:hypothetical protein